MQSMFGNAYVNGNTFSTMKHVGYKNRNRMADDTLGNILLLATTNTGTDKERTVSEMRRPRASH